MKVRVFPLGNVKDILHNTLCKCGLKEPDNMKKSCTDANVLTGNLTGLFTCTAVPSHEQDLHSESQSLRA